MISRREFVWMTAAIALASKLMWSAEQVPPTLDHMLLGCSDLDAGIAYLEQHTGVRAQFGGVHPGRGTRNALLSLGKLRYLEIIAPDPKQTDIKDWARPRVDALKQLTSPHLIGWAVHPENIQALETKLKQEGIAAQPLFNGQRKRDDGSTLHWTALNLKDDQHGLLPFFIQWSANSTHPSVDSPKGCELEYFLVTAPNPKELRDTFEKLDVEVTVNRGDRAQLLARIKGPKGELEASS